MKHALFAALCVATLSQPAAAAGQLIDIAWDAGNRFQHRAVIEPGRFLEVCGKLEAGQAVRWSFEAGAPMDFNIHYHVGKDVVYPAQLRQVAQAQDRLAVATAQDFCWMWTNKAPNATPLTLQLQR